LGSTNAPGGCMQPKRHLPNSMSPLVRMIRLLAEIEVERNLGETKAREPKPDHDEDQSSHLRPLQR